MIISQFSFFIEPSIVLYWAHRAKRVMHAM